MNTAEQGLELSPPTTINAGDEWNWNLACLLNRLPPEVKTNIYNQFYQCEILPLRLVCKNWKEEIDNLVCFKVTLNDKDSGRTRWLTHLKIKECTLKKTHRKPPQGNKTEALLCYKFKYPTFLKSLNVTLADCINYEGITVNSLNTVLNQCSKSIEKFTVSLDEISRPQEKILQGLKNLKVLCINILHYDHWEENFQTILQSASASHKITRLDITTRNNRVNKATLLVSLLKFIKVEEQTLLELELKAWMGVGEYFGFTPRTPEVIEAVKDIKYPKKLKTLELIFYGSNMSSTFADCATNLVNEQTELKTLKLGWYTPDGLLSQPPSHLVQQFGNRNHESLHEMCIFLTKKYWDQGQGTFDFVTFENFKNLRKMNLNVQDWDESEQSIKTRNFERLIMPNLTKLILEGFLIPTVAIDMFFQQELKWLEAVGLDDCGNDGDLGLNGSVMERIINLPSIRKIWSEDCNASVEEEFHKLRDICIEAQGYCAEDQKGFCFSFYSDDVDRFREKRSIRRGVYHNLSYPEVPSR